MSITTLDELSHDFLLHLQTRLLQHEPDNRIIGLVMSVADVSTSNGCGELIIRIKNKPRCVQADHRHPIGTLYAISNLSSTITNPWAVIHRYYRGVIGREHIYSSEPHELPFRIKMNINNFPKLAQRISEEKVIALLSNKSYNDTYNFLWNCPEHIKEDHKLIDMFKKYNSTAITNYPF